MQIGKKMVGPAELSFDPTFVGSSQIIAEEFRSVLKKYYKDNNALNDYVERKIDDFCNWILKKEQNWVKNEVSYAIAQKKLKVLGPKIKGEEVLASYLAMRYLFDTRAIPGKSQNLPALFIGTGLAGAGGYSPDKHAILLPGSVYPLTLEKEKQKQPVTKEKAEWIINIFNVTIHESAHSFRRAHDLPGDVNELGTYLVQTHIGLPKKFRGDGMDFVSGQRYMPHNIHLAENTKKRDSIETYFNIEYQQYHIGPYLEKFYVDKNKACPEFYEFCDMRWETKKDEPPSVSGKPSGMESLKKALDAIANTKMKDLLANNVQYIAIPDVEFNEILSKAIGQVIKKRMGFSDKEHGEFLDMTLKGFAEKYSEKIQKMKLHEHDFLSPISIELEKIVGKPKKKEIPEGFVQRTMEGAKPSDFFA